MKGKSHVYKRAHINTDEIIPARYLNVDKEAELAKYAMEDIDKNFVKKVQVGDFIVGGIDFGCGSSREHAVWALRGAGVRGVIAEKFARIFYRNCINNGFVAIECKGISEKVRNSDELEINFSDGEIKNITKDEIYKFEPLSDFANELLSSGGLMNYILKKKEK
ncbi:MAG: 3-isopropylmalate dehydratase small subunit [Candidatus Marinimicrobia bacterium]|nr:3-isopropylmalate dehydratase small subunit [Candidatus Neomarinimicrobiota bacterium]